MKSVAPGKSLTIRLMNFRCNKYPSLVKVSMISSTVVGRQRVWKN